jgi:DNA-entry nuclease
MATKKRRKTSRKKLTPGMAAALLLLCIGGTLLRWYTDGIPEALLPEETTATSTVGAETSDVVTLDNLPAYSGDPYIELYNNQPEFSQEELTTTAFETYSPLDSLGRCGVAYANICQEIMPTEPRGEIGMIKPSGWHTVKYDCVDGKYLYNRCHLIGYQLAGENANEYNLITGTRYLNVTGMLPFENQVADYVKSTDGHVLYRVTPVFDGGDLVAQGVQMEALSVEDDTVSFNVFVYNVQPGVEIDYATGESWLAEEAA